MAELILNVDSISKLDPTLYEEDSYGFLAVNQFSNWYIYDSDEIGLDTTKALVNNFMAFHGKIYFPKNQKIVDSFWSAIPLGIFRYKMLHDGTCDLVNDYRKIPGYIVEGAYWTNGFFYLVRDQDSIIQIKLFLDKDTKEIQLYPDVSKL
jgi:hypothetical protein